MIYRAYGGPERLEMADIPRPVPGPGQVLVRVIASSVNPVDWKKASGRLRLLWPVQFPAVPGFAVAGDVDAKLSLTGDYVCNGFLQRSCKQPVIHGLARLASMVRCYQLIRARQAADMARQNMIVAGLHAPFLPAEDGTAVASSLNHIIQARSRQ